tara:strand:+ start:436 stop:1002 length:567 start_codon:yes stop_codon:yes gene_type:complete
MFTTVYITILHNNPSPKGNIPTTFEIQHQDSLWNIIHQTQLNIDTIQQGITAIIDKLEQLEYSNIGSAIDDIDFDMECGDTLTVSATMYYPVVGQCDDTPDITADQTKIPDINNCSHLKWIAVSQDLLWFNDGPIRYGDTVYVVAGHKTGQYIVRDAMNKRFTYKIDFLESVGTDLYSFKDVKLLINS